MTITELIKELQNLEEYKNHTVYIGNLKEVSEVVIQESVEDMFYYEDPLLKKRRFLILNNKV